MKKTLVLSAALMTLVGLSSFAEERTLIDFTTLKADIAVYPQDYDGEKRKTRTSVLLWITLLQLVHLSVQSRKIS